MKVRGATALSPWPSLDVKTSSPAFEQVRLWLVAHQHQLATWPPRFATEAEAEVTILEWQRLRPGAEALDRDAASDLEDTVVLGTFWFFGHNVDEPDAGPRAGSLFERAAQRHPVSALPHALLGLLQLHASPGFSPVPELERALELSPPDDLHGLLELAWGTACMHSNRNHGTVAHYSSALTLDPELGTPYSSLLALASVRFDPKLDIERDQQAIFRFENQTFGSTFFGFALDLPPGWSVDKASPYEPGHPVVAWLDAPPLEGSDLVHGLGLLANFVLPGGHPMDMVRDLETKGAVSRKIQPIVAHPKLSRWLEVETTEPIGTKGDVFRMLYVEADVTPVPWSLTEHLKAAEREPACGPSPEGPGVIRPNPERGNAPVHLAIMYNASAGTISVARTRFREILKSLRLESHAGTKVQLAPPPSSTAGTPVALVR